MATAQDYDPSVHPIEAASAIAKGEVVDLDTSGKARKCPTTSHNPLGVAMAAAATGEMCPVRIFGIVELTADGTVNEGDSIRNGLTTAGRAQTLADQAVDEGGAATYTIRYGARMGRALTTATNGNKFQAIIGA